MLKKAFIRPIEKNCAIDFIAFKYIGSGNKIRYQDAGEKNLISSK